jgi:colanic acid/amylovoran biosynthesis glycosyltransferase
MRIAVFADNFPVLSQTFIINQIVGLIKLGAEVDVITNEVLTSDFMHSAVKEHSLLERVKCVGINSTKNKFNRWMSTISNVITLILYGHLTGLLDVVFDKYLTRRQKLNLISALMKSKNETIKYDNVICHFGIHGYYVCKMRDIGLVAGPISTVFHAYEISRYDVVNQYLPQYKQLFVKGDIMLPISELWGKILLKWGCPESKVKVHRMGVNINDFEIKPLSTPFSSPLKVIQVGRLTEKKAIIDSINAVVLASKDIPIEFTIIGGGELYVSAKMLIASLNASEYIHLLGPQPQDIVKHHLDESDVFLLPSVRANDGDMEGVPVALMESMAKGLITISTYHSGIPELIENEVSGFLVEEHGIDQLVNCLTRVQRMSIEGITDIRVKARLVCVEKYNNDVLNNNILDLIRSYDG